MIFSVRYVNFLKGLPREWEVLLKSAGIDIAQASKNMDKLKNVMEFNAKLTERSAPLVPLPQEENLNLGG
jgi:hypothetical protein